MDHKQDFTSVRHFLNNRTFILDKPGKTMQSAVRRLTEGEIVHLKGGAFQTTGPQFPSKGPQRSSFFYPRCLSKKRVIENRGMLLNRDFETHPLPFVSFCCYFCFELVNFSPATSAPTAGPLTHQYSLGYHEKMNCSCRETWITWAESPT